VGWRIKIFNMAKKKATKLHPVTAYAQAVLDGEIVTGRLVKLACQRHMRDLKDGHKRGIHFSEDDANHIIGFFAEFLRHYDSEFAGQPFVLSPHHQFIVGSLFGWLKSTGYRRFRHAVIEIGKGDGKTSVGSGILLYGLMCDGQVGVQIYCAANTREQAGLAFTDCKKMAENSQFADRLIITEHNIACPGTNSFIRPVSSEAKSLDGKRVFMCLLDETHEHRDGLVINKMVAGNKGLRQPLNVRTTNSGFDRTSICWREHEYVRQILEQVTDDDDWFGYICQLDPCQKCLQEGNSQPKEDCENCDSWADEKTWPKGNPNLGRAVQVDYLRGEVRQALHDPAKAQLVKRLNFCIWTENYSHWLPMDDWDACAGPLDWRALRESLKGRRCFAGLDLADTSDTASLVLIFPPDKIVKKIQATREDGTEIDAELLDEPFFMLAFVWIPSEMKNRTGQERARFEGWIAQGLIEATPGNLIDYRYILKTIGQCRLDYDLKMLAFDRWGSTKIVTELCDDLGFTVDEKEAKQYRKPLLVQMGQGFASMSSPTKEMSNLVIAHKIVHGGHPVLRWAFGNVVIDQDPAGNEKINKAKSTDKVDPAVAGVMALELAIRNPVPAGSVYEDRGLLVL